MLKNVFYNTTAQVIGKVITASTTFLITIFIGRSLGAAGYGEFTKIVVFVGYFYTIADFGFNSIYIKIANNKNYEVLFRSLVALRLLLSLFLAITAVSISVLLPYDPIQNTGFSPLVKIGIAIAAATIVTQALLTTANAYFQKIMRYDFSTVAVFSGSVFILAIAFLSYLKGATLFSYVASYVVGGVVFVLVAFLLISRRLKKLILPDFSLEASRDFIRLSWPVGIALIFNLVYFRIDVLLLSAYRSTTEVGLYGLAYQFFEASLSIPIFVNNALYPVITKMYNQSQDLFKKQIKHWVLILFLLSLLLTVFLVVIAHLIPVIYSPQFRGSIPALQILAVGMPFFFVSALFWHVVIIYNKQKLLILAYGAGAIFNFTANLIFIPKYGYLAAAAITVVSELLILAILTVIVLKRFQIPDSKAFSMRK